jgi:hypothetical protein
MKLNVLLALTDTLRAKFKNMLADHTKFYAKAQGSFLGAKSTYIPKEDAVDEPSRRKIIKVVTTVDEKIDYFIKESSQFIDALFSQEKTNGMGLATAELVVNGESWGTYTSLELLRLKSLLENSDLGKLEEMLASIPVRSDAQIWDKTTNEDYVGRNIWETPLVSGVSRTTIKEEYILEDPNLKAGVLYTPKVAQRNKPQDIGDYTLQEFSGEWSHRERAGALKRRSDLIVAVTRALKESNDCEAVESNLTANKIFEYIFKGQ